MDFPEMREQIINTSTPEGRKFAKERVERNKLIAIEKIKGAKEFILIYTDDEHATAIMQVDFISVPMLCQMLHDMHDKLIHSSIKTLEREANNGEQ